MRMNGQELRVCRALKDAKGVEVANLIMRTPTAISQVENGTRHTLDELQTRIVLEGLGIREDDFLELRAAIQKINKNN